MSGPIKNEYQYVKKSWGEELWICNSDKYCGKKLFIYKDKYCSFHYHKIKDEVLYIESGRIKFRYARLWTDQVFEKELSPGEAWHVEPGLVHQMEALEDTLIIEFSTQHFDSDSYRITSDKVKAGPYKVVDGIGIQA